MVIIIYAFLNRLAFSAVNHCYQIGGIATRSFILGGLAARYEVSNYDINLLGKEKLSNSKRHFEMSIPTVFVAV